MGLLYVHDIRYDVVLMLVINHLGLLLAWLIPTHQKSKLLLMSRYTMVTHILFLKYTVKPQLNLVNFATRAPYKE